MTFCIAEIGHGIFYLFIDNFIPEQLRYSNNCIYTDIQNHNQWLIKRSFLKKFENSSGHSYNNELILSDLDYDPEKRKCKSANGYIDIEGKILSLADAKSHLSAIFDHKIV